MRFIGKSWNKEEILRRVGDISQIGGARMVELQEGKERGVRAIDFRCGNGFNFTILPDRGMDISYAEYQGKALGWISPTGQVSPHYFEPEGFGWLRSFFGGLLTTCGLTYAGAPGEDPEAECLVSCVPTEEKDKCYLGLHGRISNTPAEQVVCGGEWEGDDYLIWASGKMRESIVFGECLEMERRIWTYIGERRLFIRDRIKNIGFIPSPLMLLYHINIGFPIVDDGSYLFGAVDKVVPRDEEAEKGVDLYNRFSSPIPGFKEQVFYLELKADEKGIVTVGIANKELMEGIAFYVKFQKSSLPFFTEWKMMGEGVYVVGLEPGNCHVQGRAKEREMGTLEVLQPGQEKIVELEMGVLLKGEIEALKQKLARV
ncbi:aldose 1-epimerase family protein [bacterium]|nr:aldose 1-epimerase family protein [bacterium]